MERISQREVNMHRSTPFLVVFVVAVTAAQLLAQAPAPAEATVYAVAYVDVTPSGRSAAVGALKAYRNASSKEAGHVRIEVVEQVGRPAHFVLVEAWRDQGAFEAHAGAAAAKQFQQALAPVRVSGYDERPYKSFSIASSRAGGTVHVVSHVDIAGAEAQAKAPAVLRQMADASRAEPGNVRFDILQHVTRANHFTVVESWTTQAALDAHAAAAHSRQYRDTLQPMTGSPLDERVYLALE
jgi:quinol monooxygenase YgiN